MSDLREALASALARSRRGVTAKVNDNDRRQADEILREFLVVPRRAVIGTEYAIERRNDSRGLWRYRAGDEADARAQSAARQVAYAKTYPVSRPILPWSPIPLGEVPDAG